MRVLFRADASPTMGTGHLMRCLALAEGLHDGGHECHFLVGESIASLDRRLEAEGAAVAHLVSSAEDAAAEATCRYAAAIGAQGIVVDGYHFSAAWRQNLRRLGPPVLSFYDDAPEGAVGADIVLCPAIDAPDDAVHGAARSATWLCGPAYLLLRRDLRRALHEPHLALRQRRSVLVTFGGSDPAALTEPIVSRLADAPIPGIRLDVVIGAGVRDRDRLVQALSRFGPAVRLHVDVPNMALLMRQAGLAISAAGTTIGELAAFGVPSVIAVVADNQLAGARRAAVKGWCRMVDARNSTCAQVIADAARQLWADGSVREAMALRGPGGIDGEGVRRVCDALVGLAAREH